MIVNMNSANTFSHFPFSLPGWFCHRLQMATVWSTLWLNSDIITFSGGATWRAAIGTNSTENKRDTFLQIYDNHNPSPLLLPPKATEISDKTEDIKLHGVCCATIIEAFKFNKNVAIYISVSEFLKSDLQLMTRQMNLTSPCYWHKHYHYQRWAIY